MFTVPGPRKIRQPRNCGRGKVVVLAVAMLLVMSPFVATNTWSRSGLSGTTRESFIYLSYFVGYLWETLFVGKAERFPGQGAFQQAKGISSQ